MFKASRTLLRVAAIVGTVCGALVLACVPVFFVIGCSSTIREMLIKAIDDGTIKAHTSVGLTSAEMVALFQAIFIMTAILLLVIGVMCVVNAIISVKTRNEPTRGRYIACIVTGALSTDFSLVAGIFGLICLSRGERQNKLEE